MRVGVVLALGAVAATIAGLTALLVQPADAADLRLNQVQMVGTAESYKLAPSPELLSLIRMGGRKDAEALDFSEPTLTVQLDAGARVLTFDIAYDPKGGLFKNPSGASMAGELLAPDYVAAMSQPGFKVMHVPDVDFESHCLTLKSCLAEVETWSEGHPGHVPIVIILHSIDSKTPIPGAATPLPFDAAAIAALNTEIASVFPSCCILTPAAVRSSQVSPGEAIKTDGWPTLDNARGKLLFVFDGNHPAATDDDSGLLFVAGHDDTSPDTAAFLIIDDPVRDAAHITAAVQAGRIVITRADDETHEARASDTRRRDQAFASGAQIIRTDFLLPDAKIGPYQVQINDGRHIQCDVVDADCAKWNEPTPSLLTAQAH